jgi:hypothetical protein
MAIDPITAIAEAGKAILNKFWSDKADEKTLTELGQNFELELRREAGKENSSFRQFILAYEGESKDSPKFIQYFRSLIRPAFTCLVGYLDWLFLSGTAIWPEDKVSLLKAISLVVLFFWFGERAVTNSGILGLLKGKNN